MEPLLRTNMSGIRRCEKCGSLFKIQNDGPEAMRGDGTFPRHVCAKCHVVPGLRGLRFVADLGGSPALWEVKERTRGGWACFVPATSGMEDLVGTTQNFTETDIIEGRKRFLNS